MTPGTAAGSVPPLVGTLPPQCQRDVDALRRVIHTAISQGSPGDAVSPAEFREVLLTGVTGFVGRFVLRDLMRHKADLVVHCLVRADHAEHGLERLRAALQQAEIWDDAFATRIRVVVGDIEKTSFGMSESAFDDLCQRVDAVYHLAADLSLAKAYAAMREANISSIRNLLELSWRHRLKHFFFASSMGVFPQYFFAFGNEFRHARIDHQMQPDLAAMKRRFPLGLLGYPWSKLVTEQVLLFAGAAGLPVAIFRLPRTAVSTGGAIQANDLAVRLLAAAADVEMIPHGFSMQQINEAVDTLSEVVTAISMNPRRQYAIYNCCDSGPPLHELEPADFGLYWPEVSYSSFKRACQARGESSPLFGYWALLDHCAPYWLGDRNAGNAQPVCDRAIRGDCPHPIRWPGLLTLTRRSQEWIARQEDWPHPVPANRLDFDCLVSRARYHAQQAGVAFEEAYPEWMRRNLQRLVQALRAPEARISAQQRGFMVLDMSRRLRNNARLAGEWVQHPEIRRQKVTRPVFIVGINRTGTTFLHRLMAQDSRFWTLRAYEYFEPVRPQEEYDTLDGSPCDPRKKALEDLFEAVRVNEAFSGIHEFGIDEPEEDFPLLRMGFAAWTTLVQYHLPEYHRWLDASDLRPAYAHHRRIMQHFTWQRRRRPYGSEGQWLFKMPFHLMELRALIQTYPDALFIQTHREPTQFMASWNSLVERLRSVSTEPSAVDQLGAEQLAFMSNMLDRCVDFRQAHPELANRWVDVNYYNLVANPLAVVRGIYERFNWRLEPAALEAMDDWLFLQSLRRQKETRHRYALQDYGLTPEAVNTAFARYRDFITREGIRTLQF